MTTTNPHLIEEISDMVNTGVCEVFRTMLTLDTEHVLARDCGAQLGQIVAGAVGFIGEVNGVVYMRVTAPFGRTLASRMLGMAEAELEGNEMINDVIGELSNMVVGYVKSRLCDSGSPCVLTIPSIVRGENFDIEPVSSSERRVLAFRCGKDAILVELIMRPPR